MPTLTAAFRADPVKFMATHLVEAQIGSLTAGAMSVRFVPNNGRTCRTKIGKLIGKHTIPACNLVPCNDQADVVSIYWLPYKDNQVFHLHLGHTARYMFTPTMDGCTFAVGGQDPVGAPLVAHANYQTQGQIDQVEIGQQLDAVYGTGKRGELSKERYTGSKHFNVGSGKVKSTTFGVSDGTAWQFWAQIWETDHKAEKVRQKLNNPSRPDYASDAWSDAYTRAASSFELLGVKRLKVRA